MKKRIHIAAALLLSSMMAVSAGAAAMTTVAEESYSITVTNHANDEATHKYTAYQVFKGTVAVVNGTNQLTEIEWGDGVNENDILTDLKASNKFGTPNLFADCNTAAEVAVVLEDFTPDSAQINAFADIVSEHITGDGYELPDQKVPGGGYYFIKDEVTNADVTKHYAISDYILRVVTAEDLASFSAKADLPSIDKKIGETYADGKKANAASIGEKVPFVLESSVPDMSRYNDYYYIIQDTMCEGLTFNNDVAITVGEYKLTQGSDFDVVTTGVAPYTFQIVFKDFYEQLYLNNTPSDPSDDGNHFGEKITVTYSATLNEKADLTSVGNPNTVDLTYSNDPNHEYKGKDKPGPGEENVMGKTPESSTKTFTTGIKLIKKDATTKELLKGAKFQITGNGVKAVLINNEVYKVDTTGTYYMLKDGTFTETAPTEDTKDKYDSTETKYVKVAAVTKDTATSTSSVNQIGYSDTSGIISFTGLGAGNYTLTELEAPEGYNKLSQNIVVNIEATLNDSDQSCTWTVKKDNNAISPRDNLFTFDVDNNKGMTLPTTGGIGTTIFYVVGGTLVAGAVVLLIAKKRMSVSDKK